MKKTVVTLLATLLALMLCAAAFAEFTQDPNDPYAVEYEADGEPIIIGNFAVLSGKSAANCVDYDRMLKATMKWINAHGGVNGRPVDFITYDSADSPEGAVKAVTRLIEDDDVKLILSDSQSADILAAMSVTEEAGIPMIGIGTGVSWTKCGGKYTFRSTTSGYTVYPSMIEALKMMGTKNCAFFYVENDLGQSANEWFNGENGALKAAGIEVTSISSYQKAENDFTGSLSAALADNPEAIVIINNGPNELGQFVKQARQQEFGGVIVTIENAANGQIPEVCGDLCTGLIFPSGGLVTTTLEAALTPKVREAEELYYNYFGEMCTGSAVLRSYDQAMVAAQALRTCGNVDDPDAIRDAILAIKGLTLAQGTYDFSAGDGDGLATCDIYMYNGTEKTVFDPDLCRKLLGME